MTTDGDVAIHGQHEDTFSDTEKALRKRIESLQRTVKAQKVFEASWMAHRSEMQAEIAALQRTQITAELREEIWDWLDNTTFGPDEIGSAVKLFRRIAATGEQE